jgi:uncharacterized cupredoxin-like copper-binding protein
MKRLIIVAALGFGLGAAGALAHDDGRSGKKAEVRQSQESKGHGAELGKPGDARKVSRTIEVGMGDDMRFTPANIKVKRGDTIRFVVKNNGALKHEMVLGTMKELEEHAALMRKSPEMEHDDPNAVSVEPGKTGTLIWQFTNSSTFDFACLVPGHFEAGMMGKVVVAEAESADSGGAMTAGVVKKVDKAAGKVTISHDPIERLGMEKKMTMVFRVKDPAMLDRLKPGDKINFIADKVNGAFTVMQFEPAK